MSTELIKVKGRTENIEKSTPDVPVYEETNILLTRFYGGNTNGVMVQMAIDNKDGVIQLTREQVKVFIHTLITEIL